MSRSFESPTRRCERTLVARSLCQEDYPDEQAPGEEKCADLMTKHLGSKIINKNVDKMKLSFEAGRAAKAAALHAVSAAPEQSNNSGSYSCTIARCTDGDAIEGREEDLSSWQAVRRAANDQRGGDRWKSRGSEGIWHRWHTSPRVSLFTPYQVAKGPASNVGLQRHRFTYGITAEGRSFYFHDDWTKP